MRITLEDILAARDEFGHPPCEEGVEAFKEYYPNGLEVRDALYVIPIESDQPVGHARWLVEALQGDLMVVFPCAPPGVPTRDGYLIKAGNIGKYCDYEEYLKRYQEAAGDGPSGKGALPR